VYPADLPPVLAALLSIVVAASFSFVFAHLRLATERLAGVALHAA
jgi:hypothetical protein